MRKLMRTLAKIVHISGGLDAVARSPISSENVSADSLTISLKDHPTGDASVRLLSVAWLECHRGRIPINRTLIFEIDPSDDKQVGWRSGRWTPIAYSASRIAVSGNLVIRRPQLTAARLWSLAEDWDDYAERNGFIYAVSYDAALAAFERRWAAREETRQANRQAARARADAHPRPRDEAGRFLRLA